MLNIKLVQFTLIVIMYEKISDAIRFRKHQLLYFPMPGLRLMDPLYAVPKKFLDDDKQTDT